MTTFDKIKHYLKSLTRDEKKEVRRRLKDDSGGGSENIVTQNITLYPSLVRGHINGKLTTLFAFENDSNGDDLLLVYPMIEFADNNIRVLKNIDLCSDLFDEIGCDMAIWGTDTCSDSDMVDGSITPLLSDDKGRGIYIFDDYEQINKESTLEDINGAVDYFIAVYLNTYYLVSGGHTSSEFPMTLTYETTIS